MINGWKIHDLGSLTCFTSNVNEFFDFLCLSSRWNLDFVVCMHSPYGQFIIIIIVLVIIMVIIIIVKVLVGDIGTVYIRDMLVLCILKP